MRRSVLVTPGSASRPFFLAAFLSAPLLVVGLVVGCNGYDAQRATDYCDFEKQNKSQCFDSKVYDSCMTCFEQCGDACDAGSTCPAAYVCP